MYLRCNSGVSVTTTTVNSESEHISGVLLAGNLGQHLFPPLADEFAKKDALPGAKTERPVGHWDHHLAAHDAQLVRVAIRLKWASALFSTVRLCSDWLTGAFGTGSFSRPSWSI